MAPVSFQNGSLLIIKTMTIGGNDMILTALSTVATFIIIILGAIIGDFLVELVKELLHI